LELDRALDELRAGRLPLLTDHEIRGLVRVAIDVRDVRNELTAERRASLRSRVLSVIERGERPTLAERLGAVAAFLARPLPVLSRAGTIALVLVAIVGGASAVSADSLPDDPLYALKLNSEQMRLSLARDAADRAAVEFGIAETRLREASALAAQDRDAEADAAASAFGEYLANAAASVAESTSPDLVTQLRARLAQQRAALRPVAAASPNAVTVLASMTQEIASVDADSVAIADAAARGSEAAASLARNARATPRQLSAEQRAKLQAAAKAAKDAADRARAAADRVKKTATERSKSRDRAAAGP
jgi:hypothetical protein